MPDNLTDKLLRAHLVDGDLAGSREPVSAAHPEHQAAMPARPSAARRDAAQP
jgi:hypothetical protein